MLRISPGGYLFFKICQISLFGNVFLFIRHHSRSGNEQKLKIVISMPQWRNPNLKSPLYQIFAENSKNIFSPKKSLMTLFFYFKSCIFWAIIHFTALPKQFLVSRKNTKKRSIPHVSGSSVDSKNISRENIFATFPLYLLKLLLYLICYFCGHLEFYH